MLLVIIAALLAPHTLEVTSVNLVDNSYLRFTFAAIFWLLIREDGNSIAGPYSSTLFQLPSVQALLWTALFLPLCLVIIYTQWRFIKGMTTKNKAFRMIGIVLAIQVIVLVTFFAYALDSWSLAAAVPLPIVHVVSALSIRWIHNQKKTD